MPNFFFFYFSSTWTNSGLRKAKSWVNLSCRSRFYDYVRKGIQSNGIFKRKFFIANHIKSYPKKIKHKGK
jgi:hypothetical protein